MGSREGLAWAGLGKFEHRLPSPRTVPTFDEFFATQTGFPLVCQACCQWEALRAGGSREEEGRERQGGTRRAHQAAEEHVQSPVVLPLLRLLSNTHRVLWPTWILWVAGIARETPPAHPACVEDKRGVPRVLQVPGRGHSCCPQGAVALQFQRTLQAVWRGQETLGAHSAPSQRCAGGLPPPPPFEKAPEFPVLLSRQRCCVMLEVWPRLSHKPHWWPEESCVLLASLPLSNGGPPPPPKTAEQGGKCIRKPGRQFDPGSARQGTWCSQKWPLPRHWLEGRRGRSWLRVGPGRVSVALEQRRHGWKAMGGCPFTWVLCCPSGFSDCIAV